jgi:tetratricopeptide (TPR) repeat protein
MADAPGSLPPTIPLNAIDELLEGITLTHRLTEQERDAGMLAFAPDLWPFKALDDEVPVLLHGGDLLDHRHLGATACAWAGPEGWLDALAPGDLVAVRYADGYLTLTTVDSADDDGAALRSAFDDIAAALADDHLADVPATLDMVTRAWIARDDRPEVTAPVSEVAAAAGLEIHEDRIALPGFDWAAWERFEKLRRLVRVHGLPDGQADKARRLLEVLGSDAPTDDDLAEAVALLAQPDLATLVVDELLTGDPVPGLETVADRLHGRAEHDRERAAARWLQGRVAEQGGDVLRAEELLHEAVTLAPQWPPAADDLATYASDRGDAKRALDLLLRAGAPNRDAAVLDLREIVAHSGDRQGRNEPCHCGSGRKYKHCHQGREEVPIERRVGWLWNKAASYVQRPTEAPRLLDVARAYLGPEARNRAVLNLAFSDTVVVDLVLHEGKGFERFLAARGVLLPADERALAEAWATTPRTLQRVVHVERGKGITLEPFAGGDPVTVADVAASTATRAGELIVTRVVSDGASGHQIVGGGAKIRDDAATALAAALALGGDDVAVAAAVGAAAVRID